MKNLAIAAILVATAFAASAQSTRLQTSDETYGQNSPVFKSEASRAQVTAELRAAQASGAMASGELSFVAAPQGGSSVSRAQVKQEVLTLRQAGKFPVQGESSGA